MIEIPSAAVCADIFARDADFASIGTNDLCQYTFAADRMNPAIAKYAQPLSAAMLRLVRMCAQAFDSAGKPLSVCGELAGEARAIPLLLGCGIRKLSMSAAVAGKIKRVVRACNLDECESLAREAMSLSETSAIVALTEEYLISKNVLS
ncbi:Phosphoenolpyruvate-protein phosphotransferase [bioreactor metagenome]|uniref:Phosphoenolpyruvate-protein phosphotransferase n=1 Tax=bioreactor metagenome TaxID=1076179 RepID=A0A645DX93_9ZZZZ